MKASSSRVRRKRRSPHFMIREVEKRGLDFGWDPSHCPAVFTGPDTAGAHYQPTDRKVERGHVLNMDFGVKFEELHLRPAENLLHPGGRGDGGPAEVRRGFDTIVTSIEMARQALKPGSRASRSTKSPASTSSPKATRSTPTVSATRWAASPTTAPPFSGPPGRSTPTNPSSRSRRAWSSPSSHGSRFRAEVW